MAGKAKLLHDHYCDGLGDCLPACPTGAITFEEREAAAYDEAAVAASRAAGKEAAPPLPCGCPGTKSRAIRRQAEAANPESASRLSQWPVQIQLVPPTAPYFQNADLLVAADCAAYAHGNFHADFIAGRVVLIGCPKLDDADYAEKLTQILRYNTIKSLTVAGMEVPCCGGIQRAAEAALAASGKDIPYKVAVLTTDGRIL